MSEELQLVPIDEQISLELVKQNVTEAIIANLREKYLPLKIAGIDDKETYLLVKDARKECKALRVLAKKICEKGREDAVAIQKAWVGKQKDVTDQIAEVEDYLEKQEKQFEADVAKDKEDRKRRHEEQLIMRQQILSAMGVLYSEGAYTLGEVSFELSVVKETEPDIWEESILPKFRDEYSKVEAERIEQDRIKLEREAELKRQQDELEQKQLELAQREHALKLAQEEQARKQREELLRIEKEAIAKKIENRNARRAELSSFGMVPNFLSGDYTYQDVIISGRYIENAEDNEWNETVELSRLDVQNKKAEAEQERLAEIETQKEAERVRGVKNNRIQLLAEYGWVWTAELGDLGVLPQQEWESALNEAKSDFETKQKEKWEKEQADKRAQDEVIRLQKLDAAKDKEKWEEMMQKVNEVVVYEMRSSQYRKKAMILREKLEEIKAL